MGTGGTPTSETLQMLPKKPSHRWGSLTFQTGNSKQCPVWKACVILSIPCFFINSWRTGLNWPKSIYFPKDQHLSSVSIPTGDPFMVEFHINHRWSWVCSGKQPHNYGQSPFWMGTVNPLWMTILNSYVKLLPEGKSSTLPIYSRVPLTKMVLFHSYVSLPKGQPSDSPHLWWSNFSESLAESWALDSTEYACPVPPILGY